MEPGPIVGPEIAVRDTQKDGERRFREAMGKLLQKYLKK
jgi:hypothetical protein